jgi:uncharacterized protein
MALKSKLLQRLLVFALFWLYPAFLPAVTPPLPDRPAQYVVDLAGVLNAETRARLNARLTDLEAATTAQVVVLTLDSLEGEPIESFSHQTAVKWGIGQKGKDNGVLLTVAVKDKKYRIEVGYGLESTLPDSLVGSLGRQYLVPNFRKGEFAAGIVATVTALADSISGGKVSKAGAGSPPNATKTARQHGSRGSINPLTAVLLLIFIVLITLNIFRKARKGGGGGFFWFGGGGGGWSSGGGGDSGGFSGGGGDFGGGGSSGSW